MAKEIETFIKLQIQGGQATPTPPVGPALGSKGLNIMDFCKQFNSRTEKLKGKLIPVIITVYKDKSYDFITKMPPVPEQLKEIANIKSGSGEPNINKVATITWEQVEKIATDKMADLNAFSVKSAMKMVAGTARSMGINVKGKFPE